MVTCVRFSGYAYKEDGGIEGFLRRVVLPYTPHAWHASNVKIGYEIGQNWHCYKSKTMRTLQEIWVDIHALERETVRLSASILSLSRR